MVYSKQLHLITLLFLFFTDGKQSLVRLQDAFTVCHHQTLAVTPGEPGNSAVNIFYPASVTAAVYIAYTMLIEYLLKSSSIIQPMKC